jgi:hypothetical protein
MLKLIAYLLVASSTLHGMEQEIVHLSEILSAKFEQIKLLKAEQPIIVTEEDNMKLLQFYILNKTKTAGVYFKKNKSVSINSGRYKLKTDSKLKKDQWYAFGVASQGYALQSVIAHHLELYQPESVKLNLSTFKTSYAAKLTGYDLAIIYRHPRNPADVADTFELKNSDDIIIFDHCFMPQKDRIEAFTKFNMPSIENLLSFKRH